jgi:hypothetical protein
MKTGLFRIILLGLIGLTSVAVAQVNFSVNGQYMNRAEYRHGFSTLAASGQDAAFFISQRARIMTNLKFQDAEIYVSIQDIRTWGSTANAAIDNAGLLSVHEAWIGLPLNKKFSLKMGRQEIAYDEDRIFGSLDWVMQARRHDAGILKFYDSASNTTVHAGFAFNQDKEQLVGTVYTVPNNYKTFQYVYFSRPFGKIKTSILFLNNGVQIQKPAITPVEYKTVFTQTIGSRLVYKEADSRLSGNVSFYYQTGTNNLNQSLSAFDMLAELTYDMSKQFSLTAGMEVLSGTDENNATPNKSKSFTPFYGTNHRFNGYMDYFFVNNHVNSVGLNDYYVKAQFKKAKTLVGAALHFFSSFADIQDDTSPRVASSKLGTELDFTIVHKLKPGISVQGGYSQMFATQSMTYLKNIADGHKQTNNWAYVMLILRPGVEWPRTGLKL